MYECNATFVTGDPIMYTWPKSICELIAKGGDVRKLVTRRFNNRIRWWYDGQFVCWSKATTVKHTSVDLFVIA